MFLEAVAVDLEKIEEHRRMEKTENIDTTHTVCALQAFFRYLLVLKYDIFPSVVLSAGIKNDLQQIPHLNLASLMAVDFSSLPSSERKVKFLLQEKHHNYKFMVEKISKWVKSRLSVACTLISQHFICHRFSRPRLLVS